MAIELPEALTIAAQMDHELRGNRIAAATLGPACASLIRQGFIQVNPADLAGRTVDCVDPRGKWIHLHLSGGMALLLTLETGGKVLYHAPGAPRPAKFHLILVFEDGAALSEQITGWGWARLMPESKVDGTRYPGHPGLNPLDAVRFTPEALAAALPAGGNLKQALIDQTRFGGIGNGYVQDILWTAMLHPKRKPTGLAPAELARLHGAMVSVLSEATRLGGSSTERDLYDHPGGYHRVMSGDALSRPCPRCGGAVAKIAVAGTSSYVCPACQR